MASRPYKLEELFITQKPFSFGRAVTQKSPALLVKPRNRRYRLRHSGRRSSSSCVNKVKPCSRELSVSWITPGNCAGYWKDQPGRPSEKLGGRTALTCSCGYPGPQTMPKYRINKTTHQPQSNEKQLDCYFATRSHSRSLQSADARLQSDSITPWS